MLYSVIWNRGNQSLVEASSPASAEKYLRDAYGSNCAPYRAKQATKEDTEWVLGMGGAILKAGD